MKNKNIKEMSIQELIVLEKQLTSTIKKLKELMDDVKKTEQAADAAK